MSEYETVLMHELPNSIRSRGGYGRTGSKWAWLHKKVMALREELPIARFRLPNKKECESAQCSITGSFSQGKRYCSPPAGFKFFTRTEPVASKDGEYFLYIGIEHAKAS